jgi:hypothetical protein
MMKCASTSPPPFAASCKSTKIDCSQKGMGPVNLSLAIMVVVKDVDKLATRTENEYL